MKDFRKLPFLAALALVLTALLTIPALADSGPKPLLAVRVEHGPEGLYYLDLLAEGEPKPEHLDYCLDWNYGEEKQAALDAELLQALRSAVPDGWAACLSQGGRGIPINGKLTGESGLHTFSYMGVPETYRVILVTKSGERWVSEPMTRHALQGSATVDWAEKTVSAPPAWMGYVLQFFATFVPTILIEGLLLLLFGYRWRDAWKPFLAVNLVTQGALALFFTLSVLGHGPNFWYLFLFVPAELVIAVAEAGLYRRFLPEHGKARATAYGLTANAASAMLGLFLAEPVWRLLVSIS